MKTFLLVILLLCFSCGDDRYTYNVSVKSDVVEAQMEIWQDCGGKVMGFNAVSGTTDDIFEGTMTHHEMDCYSLRGTYNWVTEKN